MYTAARPSNVWDILSHEAWDSLLTYEHDEILIYLNLYLYGQTKEVNYGYLFQRRSTFGVCKN